jgi:cytochrome c-type biogenesis protein CcmE
VSFSLAPGGPIWIQGGNGVFPATEVLAMHDENYMPPEADEALKRTQVSGEHTGKTLVMDTESKPQ